MFIVAQSLFVYVVSAISLYLLGRVAYVREQKWRFLRSRQRFWTWEVVFIFLIFSFVAGVRWNVGVDHQSYLKNYLSIQSGGQAIRQHFEAGFGFFTEVMAGIGLHYSFYFGVLAFFQLLFVYLTFKNERYLFPYLGLVVIMGPSFLEWMNLTRQMLVAVIFMYSTKFIVDRKFFTYAAMILACSLIHKSALVLLPIYFLPNKDIFSNRFLVFGAVVLSLYLGSSSGWVVMLQGWISYILSLIDYGRYVERLDYFVAGEGGTNWGPRRISMVVLFSILILFSKRLKERFSNTNFLMFYNLSVIGFIYFNIFASAHYIFLRPVVYFTVFYLPVTAYLLVYISELGRKYIFLFFVVLVLACSYVPLSVIASYDLGNEDYANYRFLWFYDVN